MIEDQVYCDGVVLGKIVPENGEYHGYTPDGTFVITESERHLVYRALRVLAHKAGKLEWVRKGVYRAPQKDVTEKS